MRRKFVSKSILIMLLIIFAFSAISNIVYAINEEQNDTSTELILSNYEKELVDINQPIEIVTEENVSFPTINEVDLCQVFRHIFLRIYMFFQASLEQLI